MFDALLALYLDELAFLPGQGAQLGGKGGLLTAEGIAAHHEVALDAGDVVEDVAAQVGQLLLQRYNGRMVGAVGGAQLVAFQQQLVEGFEQAGEGEVGDAGIAGHKFKLVLVAQQQVFDALQYFLLHGYVGKAFVVAGGLVHEQGALGAHVYEVVAAFELFHVAFHRSQFARDEAEAFVDEAHRVFEHPVFVGHLVLVVHTGQFVEDVAGAVGVGIGHLQYEGGRFFADHAYLHGAGEAAGHDTGVLYLHIHVFNGTGGTAGAADEGEAALGQLEGAAKLARVFFLAHLSTISILAGGGIDEQFEAHWFGGIAGRKLQHLHGIVFVQQYVADIAFLDILVVEAEVEYHLPHEVAGFQDLHFIFGIALARVDAEVVEHRVFGYLAGSAVVFDDQFEGTLVHRVGIAQVEPGFGKPDGQGQYKPWPVAEVAPEQLAKAAAAFGGDAVGGNGGVIQSGGIL